MANNSNEFDKNQIIQQLSHFLSFQLTNNDNDEMTMKQLTDIKQGRL